MSNHCLARSACGALLAATLVLAGCATPADPSKMVAAPSAGAVASATTALRESVAVRDVTGGKDTNPLWTAQIGSSDFEAALEASLRAAGLLARNRYEGSHQLLAHIEKFDSPAIGLSITATATVNYQLVERASGRTVFEKAISVPHTATVGDAFLFVERSRLAAEGAARVNISALVDELLKFGAGDPRAPR